MGFRLQILLAQSKHTNWRTPKYQNLNSIWAPTHPIAFSRAALLKISYHSSNNKLLYFEVDIFSMRPILQWLNWLQPFCAMLDFGGGGSCSWDVNWFTLSLPGSARVSDLLIPVWRVAAGSPRDTWHVTGVVWPAPAQLPGHRALVGQAPGRGPHPRRRLARTAAI